MGPSVIFKKMRDGDLSGNGGMSSSESMLRQLDKEGRLLLQRLSKLRYGRAVVFIDG